MPPRLDGSAPFGDYSYELGEAELVGSWNSAAPPPQVFEASPGSAATEGAEKDATCIADIVATMEEVARQMAEEKVESKSCTDVVGRKSGDEETASTGEVEYECWKKAEDEAAQNSDEKEAARNKSNEDSSSALEAEHETIKETKSITHAERREDDAIQNSQFEAEHETIIETKMILRFIKKLCGIY